MSFSVIIPSRTPANLKAAIACIRASQEKCRIIVVDDCEPGELAAHQAAGPEALRKDVEVVAGVKPFCFARNINLGIRAAGQDDVILLNDDACLATHFGFSYLASQARSDSGDACGVLSAGITAAVGNPEQIALPGTRVRIASHHTLVFVCVYIRRWVLDAVGLLDERYEAYGYDDDDYCERVRQHGLSLGIFDGCVVEHGVLPSTYRGDTSASLADLKPNRERFVEKWGFAPGQRPVAGPLSSPRIQW